MGLLLLVGFGVAALAIRAALVVLVGYGQPFGMVLRTCQSPASSPTASVLGHILSFTVLARIFTLHHVWRHVASACRLLNPEAAADVGSAGEAASAIGEGLADGLDFAGF